MPQLLRGERGLERPLLVVVADEDPVRWQRKPAGGEEFGQGTVVRGDPADPGQEGKALGELGRRLGGRLVDQGERQGSIVLWVADPPPPGQFDQHGPAEGGGAEHDHPGRFAVDRDGWLLAEQLARGQVVDVEELHPGPGLSGQAQVTGLEREAEFRVRDLGVDRERAVPAVSAVPGGGERDRGVRGAVVGAGVERAGPADTGGPQHVRVPGGAGHPAGARLGRHRVGGAPTPPGRRRPGAGGRGCSRSCRRRRRSRGCGPAGPAAGAVRSRRPGGRPR